MKFFVGRGFMMKNAQLGSEQERKLGDAIQKAAVA
jgi:hypothetical protein